MSKEKDTAPSTEEVHEMLRRWDLKTVQRAEEKDWITNDEAEELKRLLNKMWDGKSEAVA